MDWLKIPFKPLFTRSPSQSYSDPNGNNLINKV
jgi:hypothetical protein